MHVKKLSSLKKFVSGDKAILRELLHPDKASLKIRYSLAHAIVKPGKTTALHFLRTSEVYYILSGKGMMYVGDEKRMVSKNSAVYIPPRKTQKIKNIGKDNLIFLCIVDPAWKKSDEKVIG